MKSYRVHLIRHGVSEGARKGQYIGLTDSPLCEEGKTRLLALKKEAEYPRADACFCSANRRCRESLEILYPEATGTYLRGLEERKEAVLASIEEQGKLTDELKAKIVAAQTLVAVED